MSFSGSSLSPEIRESKLLAPTTEIETVPSSEDTGPSWLRPDFVMPNEEEALRSLAREINEATPPLRNVRFTNRHVASHIGRVALNRAMDIESLGTMVVMDLKEATNRAESLVARVSFLLRH